MGAFTTMSAYSVDLIELFENSEYGPAMGYLSVSYTHLTLPTILLV
mgnify:CR=1 FL=1